MGAMASQITILTIVYSTVNSGADQRKKHQSSTSLAFVRVIHRWPVNFQGPVTKKMLPFDDVIMNAIEIKTCIFSPLQTLLLFSNLY